MSVEIGARESTIPFGECLRPGSVEVFARLDGGGATDADRQRGAIACAGCIQREVCAENAAEIGARIYEISGSATAFVSGREVITSPDAALRRSVALPPLPDAPKTVRTRVIERPIKFDLRELPKDRDLALKFLRYAERAGQLAPGPQTPQIVTELADHFMVRVAANDPELYQRLVAPARMSPKRAHRGLEHVAIAMFQQADFERYSARKKSPQRYSPERVDPDMYYEIAHRVACDMVELDRRGFKKPERQALTHSLEEYERLVGTYLESANISPTDFHSILIKQIHNPEKELLNRWGRAVLFRPKADSESQAREWARVYRNLPPGTTPEKRPKNPKTSNEITAAMVDAIYKGADDPDPDVALNDLPYEPQLVVTVLELRRLFGKDPTFKHSWAIGHVANQPLEQAIKKCEDIQRRAAKIMAERGEGETISEGAIRRRAVSSTWETYHDIKLSVLVSEFERDLKAQAKRENRTNTVPHWALERACELYGFDDAPRVVRALDKYYNVGQVLGVAPSEIRLLQDMTFREEVGRICDPHTGKYLGFAPALHELTSLERLALAHYSGMSRLLYGVDLEGDAIAARIDLGEGQTFEQYCENLATRCRETVLLPHSGAVLPTLLHRLSEDLRTLEGRPVVQRQRLNLQAGTILTVIGGVAMELGPHALEVSGLEPEVADWLSQTIFERCHPHHNEAVQDILQALEQGVIEITGSETLGYEAAFAADIREHGNTEEIAALAYCLHIDRFMFGHNVDDLLSTQLGPGIEDAAMGLLTLVHQKILQQELAQAEAAAEQERQAAAARKELLAAAETEAHAEQYSRDETEAYAIQYDLDRTEAYAEAAARAEARRRALTAAAGAFSMLAAKQAAIAQAEEQRAAILQYLAEQAAAKEAERVAQETEAAEAARLAEETAQAAEVAQSAALQASHEAAERAASAGEKRRPQPVTAAAPDKLAAIREELRQVNEAAALAAAEARVREQERAAQARARTKAQAATATREAAELAAHHSAHPDQAPRNSFFTTLDDAAAAWLFSATKHAQYGGPEPGTTEDNIAPTRSKGGGVAVLAAAKQMQAALKGGYLEVDDRGTEYAIRITDAVFRPDSGVSVDRLIDICRACGVNGAIDITSLRRPDASGTAELVRRRAAEQRARQLQVAVEQIEHSAFRGLTPSQLQRMHAPFMAHIGRGSEMPREGSREQRNLLAGLRILGTAYSEHYQLHAREHDRRERGENYGPEIAGYVLGNMQLGQRPLSSQAALKAFFSTYLSPQQMAMGHAQLYGELVHFGEWLARRQ